MQKKATYKKVGLEDITFFQSIIGEGYVLVDQGNRDAFSHDETEDLKHFPEVVLKAENIDQISQILKYCNKELIPITPSGARTGLSGGAIPIFGGVALSTDRLNKIVNIDENNLQVTVESGVITEVLQESVIGKGLFYPPDPSSKGSCYIGGNISENAGGPKAVKYGVTKDYVLNLEVVLADGSIMWTGANVLKNSTGYNLTDLITGSEGTLAIVTKAVLRLIPLPQNDLLMLVPFRQISQACEAVSEIFKAGVIPSALEFMERDAIDWVIDKIPELELGFIIPSDIQAHLLIEVDGNHLQELYSDCEKINEVLGSYDCGEILFAEDSTQKDKLWAMRRRVAEAVKANSVYREEDTVVPRYHLPELLKGVKKIGTKYGFRSICYGHAGDGNLHVNIIKGDLSDEKWNIDVKKGIREIFKLTVSLGGTISGEHGIGLVQKEYLDEVFDERTFDLMRSIKKSFDPNNILNPGKIIPNL